MSQPDRPTLAELQAARARRHSELAHQRRMGRKVAHIEADIRRLDRQIDAIMDVRTDAP